MTKILITIPWFLPAYRAGGPIRSIANLVENYPDAAFFIFTSDTDISGAALQSVETGKWIPWNERTHVWYATESRISHELTRQATLLKPDVILMVGLYSWHFTLVPLLYCKAPRKIISVRGMLHPGALNQKKIKKRLYIGGLKLLEYQYKVIFHATDLEEEGYIRRSIGKDARVLVAGNFPTVIGKTPPQRKVPGNLKLLTVALISPMKNILSVLEELKATRSHIEYNIFGAIRDEDYWDQCKLAIDQLPENVQVIYHHAVHPDRVAALLATHHVFMLPSESENFGHAIFEALSAGRPVITSHNTPFKNLKKHMAGLNVRPDYQNDIKDAVDFFSEMDEIEYAQWCEGADRFARSFFDPETVRRSYKSIFETPVEPPAST